MFVLYYPEFTYDWVALAFSSLRVSSVVELCRSRHHGHLHGRTVSVRHPEKLLDQAGELRVRVQLLLKRHGDALEGDVVVSGAHAPRRQEVGVLRGEEDHLLGYDLLHVRHDRYPLHGHAEPPQRSCQEGAVGVGGVALRRDAWIDSLQLLQTQTSNTKDLKRKALKFFLMKFKDF